MAQLILLPGKERSSFKRHPWLFAGSVGRLEGRARPGDSVEVLSDDLKLLGRAAYSPRSQIRARFWTFDGEESVDDAFFKRRTAAAVARRQVLPELKGQQGPIDGMIIGHQHASLQLGRMGLDRIGRLLSQQLMAGFQQQIRIERGLPQAPPGIRSHAAAQSLQRGEHYALERGLL